MYTPLKRRKPPEVFEFFVLGQNITLVSGLEGWKSQGAKLTAYEYWGMHYWLDLPYVFTRQIQDFMRQFYACGLLGMHGEAQKNFATQGPNYYLAARLMWNPDADGQKALGRYYAAFGPAASDIRDYFDTFESSILDHQHKIENFAYLTLVNAWPEIFPAEALARAGVCLEKARTAVKGMPAYEERVKIVAIGFEYTRTMLELLTAYRRLGRAGVPLWCFGYQGAVAEARFWKFPEIGESARTFWKAHPEEPLGRDEKISLLKRALVLGEQRERILTENANLPAVSLGMYGYMKERGYYPWHETIKRELSSEGVEIQ